MSDLPGDATRVVGNDGIDETDTADPRVAALCDRVRRLAEAEGDESRQALERQAQEIVAAARSRTEAENTAALQGEVAAPLSAATVADAVAGADIVVTLTLAQAPVIAPGMLAEGAVLCSMGGVHEVEFAVLAQIDRVIVDELDYALLRGDFAAWIGRGEITREALEARIDADMGAVVGGLAPGRTGGCERILAVIQGMAVCDLAQAALAIERAREAGVGTHVPLQAQRGAPIGEDHARIARLVAEGLRPQGKAR